MKIAVIDNFDSFVFNLVRYLKEIDNTEVVVMRNDSINYEILDISDGILLSPGPGIPSEAGDLFKVIERYHQSKPILGVCLGHQAIGQFFGAELEACEKPIHGKSSLINQKGISALFQNIPEKFEVGRYHSWRIQNTLPNNLVGTADTDSGETMAIKHRIFPIEGVQFHPESILTPLGRTIIKNWIKAVNTTKYEKIN